MVMRDDHLMAKRVALPLKEKIDHHMRVMRDRLTVVNLVHQLDHHLKVTGGITGVRGLLLLVIIDRRMTVKEGTHIRELHQRDEDHHHMKVDMLHLLRDGRLLSGRSRLDPATLTGMMITGAGPLQGTLITGNPLLQRGDTATSGVAVTIPPRLLILTVRMTMIDTPGILLVVSLVNLTFKMF